MSQNDKEIGWKEVLCLALWDLPGAVVYGLVGAGVLWLLLTLFPPR